jgi:hypothetical protein
MLDALCIILRKVIRGCGAHGIFMKSDLQSSIKAYHGFGLLPNFSRSRNFQLPKLAGTNRRDG